MQEHWESVYRSKRPDQVSWFRPHLDASLAMIERASGGDRAAEIIDVGGGAATLADDLVQAGYRGITVLDISETALNVAKLRLAESSKAIRWVCASVLDCDLPARSLDVWHDRAVFHFLTDPADRQRYVHKVCHLMRPGGHVIVATFGPEGPTRCSGLDTVRYDASALHEQFGTGFELVESSIEVHNTPSGTAQQFIYCHLVLPC